MTTSAGAATGTSIVWQLCAGGAEVERSLSSVAAHGFDAVVGRAVPVDRASMSRRSAAARIESLSPVSLLYAEPRTPTIIWAEQAAPILDSLLGDQARDDLTRSVLGPLSEHSPRQSELSSTERRQLRATLHAVLAHNGQRGPAAKALGVHRNTLRDRLARIERLVARTIDNPDDRAELWLAIRAEEFAGR